MASLSNDLQCAEQAGRAYDCWRDKIRQSRENSECKDKNDIEKIYMQN